MSARRELLWLLHLLREEMKLDVLSAESTRGYEQCLTPVLAQLAFWLGDADWAQYYMQEDDDMEFCQFDQGMLSCSDL
jgi:hypothetical protein